ncbi:nuclear transport factor 2 family protein [Eikenella sp. S3360]|uniref:Nuclear transport factor 2 family protein n=1 Tax=Eikenella glucosivorans TaxID=2766967 RepID=A0ABS0N9F4_9NEIS|nr:nuclear transport factor 2 family protein [Eikenella glucosivorans]MBH5328941.1 nuclear transport factor 2 family protein [Eikenella glucosivorans]
MNALIEKQALKELVDTFSNLADEKKVAEQGPLFTEDAHVTTYIGGQLFADMTSRDEIVNVFTNFLANFKAVYHINGQFTVSNLTETGADAINYCHVVLTEEKDGKTLIHNHYVRYNDSYAKVGGQWLIKRRIANFMVSDSRELGTV